MRPTRLARGVLGLFAVLGETSFRVRGRYWVWRHETAFGRGSPSRPAMIAATLEYGEWVCRMRRLGRPAARIEPLRGGVRPDTMRRTAANPKPRNHRHER